MFLVIKAYLTRETCFHEGNTDCLQADLKTSDRNCWRTFFFFFFAKYCFLLEKQNKDTGFQDKSAEFGDWMWDDKGWWETGSDFCYPDGYKPIEHYYLWDVWAAHLRAMSLLRAQSRSITVNLQSIGWPTTHEWNLATFTDASILKRKKIFFHTIDFSLVLIGWSVTSITPNNNSKRRK